MCTQDGLSYTLWIVDCSQSIAYKRTTECMHTDALGREQWPWQIQ